MASVTGASNPRMAASSTLCCSIVNRSCSLIPAPLKDARFVKYDYLHVQKLLAVDEPVFAEQRRTLVVKGKFKSPVRSQSLTVPREVLHLTLCVIECWGLRGFGPCLKRKE